MNCYFQLQYYTYCQFFLLLQYKCIFRGNKNYSNKIMSTFGLLVFIKNIILYGESYTATVSKLCKCLSLSGNLIRGILQLKLSI